MYGTKTDIAVFLPGDSLLTQVAQWVQEHAEFSLNVIQSGERQAVTEACGRAARVVIDGTARPTLAGDVLELAIDHVEPNDILLYIERTDASLEIFARTRGVALALGPMAAAEWDAMLEPVTARHASCWNEPQPCLLKVRSAR